MKSVIIVPLVAASLLACKKPASEAGPAPAPAVAAPPQSPAAPSTVISKPPEPVPPGNPGEEPSLAEVNRALNAYMLGMMKEPATLEDLVKSGYLKRLPPAPAGKKFVLNAKKSAVLVVDK